MVKRVTSIPMLYDIEARIRMMDGWPGYQQVLTLSNPPIETIAGPKDAPTSPALPMTSSRICERRPDKFPAWVASLPLNNVGSLAARDGPRDRGWRAWGSNLHERQWPGTRLFNAVAGRRTHHRSTARRTERDADNKCQWRVRIGTSRCSRYAAVSTTPAFGRVSSAAQ